MITNELTGGSDKCGFPMRRDVQGTSRKRILAVKGVGIKHKSRGIKQRKTVCGNTIHADIIQVNLKVLKQGNNVYKELNSKKSKAFRKIDEIEERIYKSVQARVKDVGRLFSTNQDYETVRRKTKTILALSINDGEIENFIHYQKALRYLLQVLATENNYEDVKKYYEEYLTFASYDEPSLKIYTRALKEIEAKKQNELIKEILKNIEDAEFHLREVVMLAFNNSERELINFAKDKNRNEWIERWELTRNKSLVSNSGIIHYSDLSQSPDNLDLCIYYSVQ